MHNSYPDRQGWVTGPLTDLPAEGPFPGLTDLEAQVLHEIALLFGASEALFRQQVKNCQVTDRINTGAGFYTRLNLDRLSCQPVPYSRQGGHFHVGSIAHGLGIVLWDKDGYLETIEGYTIGNESLTDRALSSLHYMGIDQLG